MLPVPLGWPGHTAGPTARHRAGVGWGGALRPPGAGCTASPRRITTNAAPCAPSVPVPVPAGAHPPHAGAVGALPAPRRGRRSTVVPLGLCYAKQEGFKTPQD